MQLFCVRPPNTYLVFRHRRIYGFWLTQIFTVELIWTPLWFYILSTHCVYSPDFGDAVISGLLTQPGTVIRGCHIHSVNCLPSRVLAESLAYEYFYYPFLQISLFMLRRPDTFHHNPSFREDCRNFLECKVTHVSSPEFPAIHEHEHNTREDHLLKTGLHNVHSQSKLKTLSKSTCLFTGSYCHKSSPACSNYATYF